MSGVTRRLRDQAKKSPPKTADGVTITVGMTVWEITTRDAGKSWAVSGPYVVDLIGSLDSWRYTGQRYLHTSLGDRRSFASRTKAAAEVEQRNAKAAELG